MNTVVQNILVNVLLPVGSQSHVDDITYPFYVPNECPLCHKLISPRAVSAKKFKNAKDVGVMFVCPGCGRYYVVGYSFATGDPMIPKSIGPKAHEAKSFDDRLHNLSPDFVRIYNQASLAEHNELSEIAGIGYRKALEFLIKDYLIFRDPSQADAIRNDPLGRCISERVDQEKLKLSARNAVWLGNDFTHYTRKFENKEVADMKDFIDAVCYWILMELITSNSLDRS